MLAASFAAAMTQAKAECLVQKKKVFVWLAKYFSFLCVFTGLREEANTIEKRQSKATQSVAKRINSIQWSWDEEEKIVSTARKTAKIECKRFRRREKKINKEVRKKWNLLHQEKVTAYRVHLLHRKQQGTRHREITDAWKIACFFGSKIENGNCLNARMKRYGKWKQPPEAWGAMSDQKEWNSYTLWWFFRWPEHGSTCVR